MDVCQFWGLDFFTAWERLSYRQWGWLAQARNDRLEETAAAKSGYDKILKQAQKVRRGGR